MAVVPLAPMCNRRSVNCSSATNAFSCRGSSETTRRYCAAAASNFPLRCSARPSWKRLRADGLEIDKACPDLDGLFEPALAQEETSQTAQCGRSGRACAPTVRDRRSRRHRRGRPCSGALRPKSANPDVEGFAQKARERRYGLPSRWPNPLEPSHWCCLGTAASQVNCANIFGGQSAGAIESASIAPGSPASCPTRPPPRPSGPLPTIQQWACRAGLALTGPCCCQSVAGEVDDDRNRRHRC